MPRQRRDIRNFKPRDRRGVSQHFTPQGRVKRSFDTYEAAEAFLEKHNLSEEYRPYRCKLCGKFHNGNRKHGSRKDA